MCIVIHTNSLSQQILRLRCRKPYCFWGGLCILVRKWRPFLFLFQTKVWNNLLVEDSVQCLQSKGASSSPDSGPFLGKQLHLKDIVEMDSVAHKSCFLPTVITEVFRHAFNTSRAAVCVLFSLFPLSLFMLNAIWNRSVFLNTTFTCFLPDMSEGKITFCVTRLRARKLFHKLSILRKFKKRENDKKPAVVMNGCELPEAATY